MTDTFREAPEKQHSERGHSANGRADTTFDPAEFDAQPATPKRKNGQPIVGRRDRDAARKALGELIRRLNTMDLYEDLVNPLSEFAEAIGGQAG